jgi:hypothetical protein
MLAATISIGRGAHDDRAWLQENFRGWILRYVCNATADSEVQQSFPIRNPRSRLGVPIQPWC